MEINALTLKECRNNLGITQKQLANNLGVSEKTVSNWEAGKKIPETKKAILRATLFKESKFTLEEPPEIYSKKVLL